MADWQEFEVDGQKFRIKPLKVYDAEDLAQPLVELMAPVGAALISEGQRFSDVFEAIRGIGLAVKQEKVFREKFVEVCEFLDPNDGNERWLPLKPSYNDVFQRNHLRRYGWLRECITLEFHDFLAAIGQNAMKTLEAKFSAFLSGYGGASTESQPPADTTTA